MEPLSMDDNEPAPERPNLLFEEGSYTLSELLESHLLPVVVQYDLETQPLPFNEFNFDFSQPLLLYKKRNIQKVSAKSLHISNNRYEEAGESLLIPEDYKGWFSVLPRIADLSAVNVDKVPHFCTVEELANSNSERFLIGGTKRLTGVQIDDRSSGQLEHTEIHISPGEVLTREKIYFGETRKKSRLFRKPKYIIEKFLMCRDEMEREILLPFEQQGIYYQISHKGGKAYNNVLQMSDVVARKMTPRLIKLVYGRFPVTQSAFTGLMKAESSDIETSVIACTLVNTKNVLLEIPVSTAMNFRIALTNDSLRLNTCYRNAISLCAERANTYMRNIKVCANFPVDTDESPDDFISKRNRSNSFDIDAIQSSPRKGKENPMKKTYGSLKRPTGHKVGETNMKVTRDLRLSESLSSDVSLRPGRCFSTGRMSFCLGNSYLTVPLLGNNSQQKRDSGNNNSIHQSAKSSSRSFVHGVPFGEECDRKLEDGFPHGSDSRLTAQSIDDDLSPPPPCTIISSYVNLIEPPTAMSGPDAYNYISVSSNRTPSSTAPEYAPPPLPVSSGGASSGLSPAGNNQTDTRKGSRDAFEYAVPKRGEPSKMASKSEPKTLAVVEEKTRQPMSRRPSTFTFTEGCLQALKAKRNESLTSPIEGDSDTEDDCPVYENIGTLMEAVTEKEELLKSGKENLNLYNVTELDEEDPDLIETEMYNTNANASADSLPSGDQFVEIESDGNSTLAKLSPEYDPEDSSSKPNCFENASQDCETGNRVRKIGVVNTFNNYRMGGLSENAAMQTINEANNCVVDEPGHVSPKVETELSDSDIDQKAIQTNGKMWLCGLKKACEVDSRHTSPHSPLREEDIQFMSNCRIVEHLKLIGIKDSTLKTIAELGVNGKVLCDVLKGERPISDCLVGVNLVDQQKISMFIRGWRPDKDYI